MHAVSVVLVPSSSLIFKNDTGLDEVIVWLEQQIKVPAGQRCPVIDARASYVGQSHSHDHGHTHSQ